MSNVCLQWEMGVTDQAQHLWHVITDQSQPLRYVITDQSQPLRHVMTDKAEPLRHVEMYMRIEGDQGRNLLEEMRSIYSGGLMNAKQKTLVRATLHI